MLLAHTMFSSEDFGSNVFRVRLALWLLVSSFHAFFACQVGNVDDVVLSPAHKSVANRYFASRSPVAAAPPAGKPLNWICACCEAENGAQEPTCGTCMVPRPPNAKTVAPAAPVASAGTGGGFTFGATEGPVASGFTFGDSSSSAAPVSGGDFGFQAPAAAATTGFTFGDAAGGGGGGFAFGGGTPATTGFAMDGPAAPAATAASGGAMWKCLCCEAVNAESAGTCGTCMVPNPKAAKAAATFSLPDKPIVEEKKRAPAGGVWVCQCCEAENAESSATCGTCMVPNPKAAKAATTFALPEKPIVAEKKRAAEEPLSPAPAPAAGRAQGSKKQAKMAPEAETAAAAAPAGWKCAVCESPNDAVATRCEVCNVVRKGAAATTSTTGTAAAAVVLSERHRAIADAYFAKRAATAASAATQTTTTTATGAQRVPLPSPRTPPTEKSGKSSPASSNNNSVSDVTFNLTPIQHQPAAARGSVRKREADFISPEVLRYEKKQITKEAVLPGPVTAPGGWKCSTCDWKNEREATHCVLCLDKK